eukprot:256319_1
MVFERLRLHNIKLRIDKCLFAVKKTEYLGFIIDKLGIYPKEGYKKKVLSCPEPNDKPSMRRFIGLVQFLADFIPNMQKEIALLSETLTKSYPKSFTLNGPQQHAFNRLKHKVEATDYLMHPDLDWIADDTLEPNPFHFFCDASKSGIGSMLAQCDKNGVMHPISYTAKVFNDCQRNWHVSEQELFAVVHSIEKYAYLLRCGKFIVHTDHRNLEQLFNKAKDFKTGKLFRWAVRLQDFHFECKYIKGTDNTIADYLSRDAL